MLRTTANLDIFFPATRQIRCNITNWHSGEKRYMHRHKFEKCGVCENEQMALLSYQAAISNAAQCHLQAVGGFI
jgi:hypothetical protein